MPDNCFFTSVSILSLRLEISKLISSPLFLMILIVMPDVLYVAALISLSLNAKKFSSISAIVNLQFFVISSGYGETNL